MNRFISLLIVFLSSTLHAQDGFVWDSKHDKIKIPFESVYNLIVIPVDVNGSKLNMLLDTGAENSIIFSLSDRDSIEFQHPKKINLRGLGSDQTIEALESNHNKINISGYKNDDFSLQIVLNQDVNFSARLGVPVNGILGYAFFQNHILEINYQKKILTIHKDKRVLSSRKLKNYHQFPIKVIDNRPYINVEMDLDDKKLTQLKLLIDIGLGDGLWLFENDSIKSSQNYFEDILGRGLSGDVFGKRSRINALKFADFNIKEPLVCFPHKAYFPKSALVTGRNGSIGGGILHRFDLILDYSGQKMYLKKNILFEKPFHYNMSGLEIEHSGIEYIPEKVAVTEKTGRNFAETQGDIVYRANDFKYKFSLKPIFKVVSVRENSPAAIAGIKSGDKILRLNKRNIHKFTLQNISELFQTEEGKWIYIDIERNGTPIAFKFQLKKII